MILIGLMADGHCDVPKSSAEVLGNNARHSIAHFPGSKYPSHFVPGFSLSVALATVPEAQFFRLELCTLPQS
jgi:hypothetical protein